jgi:hypothetical protein
LASIISALRRASFPLIVQWRSDARPFWMKSSSKNIQRKTCARSHESAGR